MSDLLIVNDWMVKVDFKEAYYAVPVSEFTQLPMELREIPVHLSSIWPFVCPNNLYMNPVVVYLREKDICLIIYIDDRLIMAPSE